MKNFKRILTAMLALMMVMALAACGQPAESTPSSSGNKPEPSQVQPVVPSEPEKTEPSKAAVTYRVKVVDEAGKPIVGVMVQLCKDTCSLAQTNEEGYAEFTNTVEDGYHANIAAAPEGYEYDSKNEVNFESGETEMTFVLKAAQKTEE